MTQSTRQGMQVACLLLLHLDLWAGSAFAAAGQQILVMSYHNCGSSLLAKLLIMLGMHAGDTNDLAISAGNKLKYFELRSVVDANER